MSVLVNGMEMPTSCAYCRFEGGGYCFAKGEKILHVGRRDDVHPDCPLIPVPPHGRLIDADKLADSFEPSDFWNHNAEDNCFAAVRIVHSAPTIIPASEEGE